MKKSIAFLMSLVMAFYLTGCSGKLFYTQKQYSTYKDFEKYQSDFEAILSIVQQNSKGSYYMDYNKKDLYYYYQQDDSVLISSKRIILSESEKESLYNIVKHSEKAEMDNVYVEENYVVFYEEFNGWGVMYSEDIKTSIKLYNEDFSYIDDYFTYKKLSDNWYAIYY